MSEEGKQIRRNKAYRKALMARRQADYWRKRWQTHPESMRSNLEALNRTRKEKAAERTQRLLAILSQCPKLIPSWEMRTVMESAISRSGYTLKPGSFKTLMVALRRRGLVEFNHNSLHWHVKVA